VAPPPRDGALRDILPALSTLPLFPLATVLFPGTLIRLHVFEPRYRALVRDALDSHRALAIVKLVDSNQPDAQGLPPIARVACVGTIEDHTELEHGRLDIVVRGRARVELDELPLRLPYRRAQAKVLQSSGAQPSSRDVATLLSTIAQFVAVVRERDPRFAYRPPQSATGARLADSAAHRLVLDASERQAILEALDRTDRVRRVIEALALQRLALSAESSSLN
jgi:ATP-dependent Lon protease